MAPHLNWSPSRPPASLAETGHTCSYWSAALESRAHDGNRQVEYFLFLDEGPRSRRYGRTAALRLIVQPYDEGEDNCYFLS
jgi:hypothetical protein